MGIRGAACTTSMCEEMSGSEGSFMVTFAAEQGKRQVKDLQHVYCHLLFVGGQLGRLYKQKNFVTLWLKLLNCVAQDIYLLACLCVLVLFRVCEWRLILNMVALVMLPLQT